MADNCESVVIEKTPGTVQQIITRDELGSSQAFGVAGSMTEHLLLRDVDYERLLIGGVEEGELEGGRDGLGLFVPPVEIEGDKALSLRLVTVGVEQDTPLGGLGQTNVQAGLGGPQHQLGGAVDLAELSDPHNEAVLQIVLGLVEVRVGGHCSSTSQH